MTDRANAPLESAYSPDLRRRAAELAELTRAIERSVVMSLVDDPAEPVADRRTELCHELLRRNLHQLHRAADDLRVTAMRFRARADQLDAAMRVAA